MIKRLNLIWVLLLLAIGAQAQNYDEAKVLPYTLPDVLTTADGKKIKDKSDWEKQRRTEIVRLFENHVYGQMPKDFDNLTYKVTKEVPHAMGGKAHLKEVTITVTRTNRSRDIHLILFTPAKSNKPVPAFLLINNRGKENTDPARISKSEFWPAETIIASGYAVAAIHVSDGAPDDKTKYQDGILHLYPEQLQLDNGMKAIGAWAWTASRVLDYLQKDKGIDAKRVAVVGHSRGGKAALWAGAQDKRFAMVFSNCSGNTGAALARRRFGETIKKINTSFPHWFTNNYTKYNDNEEALPVDQHMLLALIAPRPVYATNATKDLWADPKGTYLSLINAQPVYSLYKKASGLTPEPPEVNKPIINSFLGYHNREGIHDLTLFDWQQFIKFADYHYANKK